MKVGELAGVVLVRQERGLLATSVLVGIRTLFEPRRPSPLEIATQHLGSPFSANLNEWLANTQVGLRLQPVLDSLGEIRP